jgi:putative peptide zinc metalloprotease protein
LDIDTSHDGLAKNHPLEMGFVNVRESLFSPLWHRYAQQRPQLRTHITVQTQRYRGQAWYLLINETNGSHFRINEVAYQFIGRCDGRFTVQQVWDTLLESLGDKSPTQDELIRLLGELDQKDLIRYEAMPDVTSMFRRKQEKIKRERMAFINPLSFKLPLFDPTAFLDKTRWLQKLIFNPVCFIVWLVIVIVAILTAASHWHELRQHAANYMSTPLYLFLAWASFPFIKTLHELSHALAVRHWDGQVKECGVTFFVFTPAPYVDASASTAFRSQLQRVIVGAIGMMVELIIAAVALGIWFSTQSGIVHALAFVTMFVCGITSLLFNGNPLVRFDAYHILCDTFDLPNLAARSKTFWTNLINRFVLGTKNTIPMSYAEGEKKWLIAYAPLSTAYSVIIMAYIVFWLGAKSMLAGLLIALFALFNLLIKPVFGTIKQLLASATIGATKRRATLMIGSSLLLAILLIFVVPMPFNTTAQGIIWLPETARIRPNTTGFIQTVSVENNAAVVANQIILVLSDPALIAKRDNLKSQLAGMHVDQYNLMSHDITRASSMAEQIEKVGAELSRVETEIADLTVRSQVSGKLVMPHQDDLMGTFVQKGAVLAYVLNQDNIKVRAAIPEPAAGLIRNNLMRVEVRTTDHLDYVLNAQLSMDTPAVTRSLPSAALGDNGGGVYATDPSDKNGLTAVEPLVLIDLNIPNTALERVGARAFVRFDHAREPIASQLYRHARQLFLRYFNPND